MLINYIVRKSINLIIKANMYIYIYYGSTSTMGQVSDLHMICLQTNTCDDRLC